MAIIDDIEVSNREMLKWAEVIALTAAVELQDRPRARLAGERLLGMQFDQTTEMTLVDQLIQLGLRDLATSFLQTARHRAGGSVSILLKIAAKYKAALVTRTP